MVAAAYAAPSWGSHHLHAPAPTPTSVVNPLMSLLAPTAPSTAPSAKPAPVAPRPPPKPRPALWVRVPAPEGGTSPAPFYFFHRKTGATTWDDPPAVEGVIDLQVR